MAQRNTIIDIELGWIPSRNWRHRSTSTFKNLLGAENTLHLVLQFVGACRSLWPVTLTSAGAVIQHVSAELSVCVAKYRKDQENKSGLAAAAKMFPALMNDISLYGSPSMVLPLPTWRSWRVDVWWCFPESTPVLKGWILGERRWMKELCFLPTVYESLYLPGGVYKNLRLELSSWTWDYDSQCWEEEDRV